MQHKKFSTHLKRVIDESENVFSNLQALNKNLYRISSHFYNLQSSDNPPAHIENLLILIERLEHALKKIDEAMKITAQMRDPFLLDKSAPSYMNQSFAVGYARMSYRSFNKAHFAVEKLLQHVEEFAMKKDLISMDKIRLFMKIYGRFMDTEIQLSQGLFTLKIAYNYALSLKVMKQLLGNELTIKDLRKGDIILSYKTSPFLKNHYLAKLISFAEHAKITHSAIVYSAKGDHVKLFAASGDEGLLGIYDIKPKKGEFWFVFRPNLRMNQRLMLHTAIDHWVEEVKTRPRFHRFPELKSWIAVIIGYLHAELVMHGNYLVMVSNPIHSKRDYFCSDIIDAIFKSIGIHLVPRSRNDGVVGPVEFFYSPYLSHIGVFYNHDEEDSIKNED